jgi:hypothetical protein
MTIDQPENIPMPDDYDPDSLSMGEQLTLRQMTLEFDKMTPLQLRQSCIYLSYKNLKMINTTRGVINGNLKNRL